jgi:hypothetical protein
MRCLVDAGIVDVHPRAQSRIYSLERDALSEMARQLAADSAIEEGQDDDAVTRAFFDGPRLRQNPASRKKRVVVLRRLLRDFQPGRTYAENEVNAILSHAHEDVATLRRELVNYGFLLRDRGTYQLATEPPPRGSNVRQEVGQDMEWFPELVRLAAARAVATEP